MNGKFDKVLVKGLSLASSNSFRSAPASGIEKHISSRSTRRSRKSALFKVLRTTIRRWPGCSICEGDRVRAKHRRGA